MPFVNFYRIYMYIFIYVWGPCPVVTRSYFQPVPRDFSWRLSAGPHDAKQWTQATCLQSMCSDFELSFWPLNAYFLSYHIYLFTFPLTFSHCLDVSMPYCSVGICKHDCRAQLLGCSSLSLWCQGSKWQCDHEDCTCGLMTDFLPPNNTPDPLSLCNETFRWLWSGEITKKVKYMCTGGTYYKFNVSYCQFIWYLL